MTRARVTLAVVVVSMLCVRPAPLAQGALPEGWVVLPVDEYRALRERAYPSPPPTPSAPVDATLTRVDYELRADGDAIAGRALLTIDVLRDGWARVQIPSGLMVREAVLDGRPVALVEGTSPHVLLSRRGRSILSLDIALPPSGSGGAESIVLPPSPSPISRARLAIPRTGVDLTVNGGFVADHAETSGESRWTMFARPNTPLSLTWKRKVDDRRAEQPLRLRARVTELVGLAEESCQLTTAIRVEIIQGLARDVVVELPSDFVVNEVTGATVADWNADGTRLRVALLEPTGTDASFLVQGEARVPRSGPVAVPLLRVPAAERESGGVAVDVAGAGEIGSHQVRGLDPADPTELGDLVANRESPSMVAFRHRSVPGSEPRALTVDVVRYTPQAVAVANVEEARYRALVTDDGRLLVQARYAIRNNQRSFLKAVLPRGAALWSAAVAGRPTRPGLSPEGALLLPLEKSRPGEQAPTFVAEVMYVHVTDPWSDKSRARLEFPTIDLPVSRTGIELYHSPRYRIEPQAGSFRTEADPGPFAEAFRTPQLSLTIAGGRDERAASALQALVDRYNNESGGRTSAGTLPVHVEFPTVGPSIFLASELTAEMETPSLDLLVRRVDR